MKDKKSSKKKTKKKKEYFQEETRKTEIEKKIETGKGNEGKVN